MKKQISTKAVTTTILDSAKSKLISAINLIDDGRGRVAWKIMQDATQDLYMLETILYYEQEHATINKLKDISSKLANTIHLDKVSQTSKECYKMIKDFEYDIKNQNDEQEFHSMRAMDDDIRESDTMIDDLTEDVNLELYDLSPESRLLDDEVRAILNHRGKIKAIWRKQDKEDKK